MLSSFPLYFLCPRKKKTIIFCALITSASIFYTGLSFLLQFQLTRDPVTPQDRMIFKKTPVSEFVNISTPIIVQKENASKILAPTSDQATHNSTHNIVASHSDYNCEWVNFTAPKPPYFLTVVFIVRIYENDKSEMTSAEIKQWLEYLRYAGVEHVYLYDIWYLPGESQRQALDKFIMEGYLTYTDWHKYNPYIREKSQLPAYQHCLDNHGDESTWQSAIDIDEYPFSPSDKEPGFLYRYVKKFAEQHTSVSEITMNNYLFLGEKNKRELLIERLWRRTHGPSNPLVKPIYKPPDINRAQVHHNQRRSGQTKTAPDNELRMNHYWGARLQNWGPDTPEILAKTEEDLGMETIVTAFKNCEKYVRHYLK